MSVMTSLASRAAVCDGVEPYRVSAPGLQPELHDTTTTSTDPAGSTLATPSFGPKDGVHLNPLTPSLV
jgi:hypothetical protein